MEMIDLQNKFASHVANSMRLAWDEIRIHYENALINEERKEVYIATFTFNSIKQDLDLSLEALDILVDLKRCKPKSQSDEWIWFEFFIDKTGKYKFDYKYSDPPLIMQQIKYSK